MLGGVMDFITAVVLGNAVSNIEKIGSWLNKIGFDKIFKGISNFINMLAQGATNLLAKAVKLPEEFPDTSKEKPQNKVKPLTTSSDTNDTKKIDNTSWSYMFSKGDEENGGDIINQMLGYNIENDNMFKHSLYNLNFDQEGNLSGGMNNFNFDSELNLDSSEESIDYLHFINQTILID